jgi:hypothetical protein
VLVSVDVIVQFAIKIAASTCAELRCMRTRLEQEVIHCAGKWSRPMYASSACCGLLHCLSRYGTARRAHIIVVKRAQATFATSSVSAFKATESHTNAYCYAKIEACPHSRCDSNKRTSPHATLQPAHQESKGCVGDDRPKTKTDTDAPRCYL